MTLTQTEIDAIRARVEAATAGEWVIEESRYEGLFNVGNQLDDLSACLMRPNNAEFIAHARQDVPKLLAEVEYLRNERIYWRQENDRMRAHNQRLFSKVETYESIAQEFDYYGILDEMEGDRK
ncbi:hypothetical protein [Mesobacillus zeae]|uniref:hypothetical protein n=1 Tax=Mesobacillus zeae TaxID=1917180 RepID=UPI00300A597D